MPPSSNSSIVALPITFYSFIQGSKEMRCANSKVSIGNPDSIFLRLYEPETVEKKI